MPAVDGAEGQTIDWDRLPPKLARDLVEGRRQSVAAEYRRAVDAYFRVVAQQARQRGQDN